MLNLVNTFDTLVSKRDIALSDIERLNRQLFQRFKDKVIVQPSLSRSSVSFQANKTRPVYRWYKFKEAFSASLVEYLFHKYSIITGRILDPFAGSGTADGGHKVSDASCLIARLWSTMNHLVTM